MLGRTNKIVEESDRGAGFDPAESSDGFTLIEVCWTLAIFAVVAGIGTVSMTRWAAAERQGATTSEIEALLREAQQRSITEGRTLCLRFDLAAQTYSVMRGACTGVDEVRIEGPMRLESGVSLATAAFAASGGGLTTGVTFYPRGTATPGTLTIARKDSDRIDTLVVDGLTGRVSRG
jgi:prepilin-type N-terminal cleavage/methylation domain-containing protein